jgi:hypothetical protein
MVPVGVSAGAGARFVEPDDVYDFQQGFLLLCPAAEEGAFELGDGGLETHGCEIDAGGIGV